MQLVTIAAMINNDEHTDMFEFCYQSCQVTVATTFLSVVAVPLPTR